MPVVDLHHHFVPEGVLDQLRAMAGGKGRLVNDRISITLNPDLCDAEAHLATMDAAGVDVAVLTQSGLSVLGPGTCRDVNEGIAEAAAARPDRFVGTAHVDIDDEAAPKELERCIEEYGFGAIALPCSSPERELDDASLEPLWSTIENLGLPVILHPAQLPKGASLDYALERSCFRPFDTTVAGVRLFCGVLPKHSGLRFVLPHCGGTSVGLKGRLAMFFERPDVERTRQLPRTISEQRAEGLDVVFAELWSKFYFDTAGTGAWSPLIEFTCQIVGSDHLAFGTDFPLESHSGETMRELVEMIEHLPVGEGEREDICSRTAVTLIGAQLTSALDQRGDGA